MDSKLRYKLKTWFIGGLAGYLIADILFTIFVAGMWVYYVQ